MTDKMAHKVGLIKLKVETPSRGPSFWFGDTFTATKRRSLNPDISWHNKEEAAFKSLSRFGIARGDYRYVEMVDGKCSLLADYEGTSASFARQKLEIPEKFKFLDLNGVLSLYCLRFFATDYKRVVSNLLDAWRRGNSLSTWEMRHLLLKKGRYTLFFPEVPRLNKKRARALPSEGETRVGASEDEPARKKQKHGAAPTSPTVEGSTSSGECDDAVGEEGDSWLDSDFDSEQDILSSLIGLFEARRTPNSNLSISITSHTIRQKAEKAAEVLGINPSFPIYKKLVKRLAKCEGMTTTRATRNLNLWVQTGISKVPDLNCALTIFALTEMASDLHRLVIGIRQLIKRGKDTSKEQLAQLLHEYQIHDGEEDDLIITDDDGEPICDEPEALEYVEHYKSRLAWKARSRAGLD